MNTVCIILLLLTSAMYFGWLFQSTYRLIKSLLGRSPRSRVISPYSVGSLKRKIFTPPAYLKPNGHGWYIVDTYILNHIVQFYNDNPNDITIACDWADSNQRKINVLVRFTDDSLRVQLEQSFKTIKTLEESIDDHSYFSRKYSVYQAKSDTTVQDCLTSYLDKIQEINNLIGVNKWYVGENNSMSVFNWSTSKHICITSSFYWLNQKDFNYIKLTTEDKWD